MKEEMEKDERFIIRTYEKAELAHLYNPNMPLVSAMRKLRAWIRRNRQLTDALTATGKGGAFAVACALSLVLFFVGGVIALAIGNAFIAPVLAVGFALIPFGFALRTVSLYRQKLREELDTALSVMTTSYLRTDDLTAAVREN